MEEGQMEGRVMRAAKEVETSNQIWQIRFSPVQK